MDRKLNFSEVKKTYMRGKLKSKWDFHVSSSFGAGRCPGGMVKLCSEPKQRNSTAQCPDTFVWWCNSRAWSALPADAETPLWAPRRGRAGGSRSMAAC